MSMQDNNHPGENRPSFWKRISIAEVLSVLLLSLLVLVVGATVFFRYVLNIGIEWGDEVARIMFVWIVFLGAYLAFKRKSHAEVTFLSKKIPRGLRKYHALLVGLLEVAFMLVIMWYGFIQVQDTAKFGQVTAGLGVPMWWFYVVIPVMSFFMMIVILSLSFQRFKAKRGDEEWVD
jgi:TRAP-type transport system small permease protein